MATRTPIQHLELDAAASDFLELLKDLGHIDPIGMDRISGQLVGSARPNRRLTLEEVRRVVAAYLFDHEGELRPDQREVLQAEWGRLFF